MVLGCGCSSHWAACEEEEIGMTDFDKQFGNMQKVAIIGSLVSLTIGGGLLAFAVWVVIALLKHFGVM